MIRCRTLWPDRVGGVAFKYPNGGHWRVNAARTHWRSEGIAKAARGSCWPAGPGRERRISWWRMRLRLQRAVDRAIRRVNAPKGE